MAALGSTGWVNINSISDTLISAVKIGVSQERNGTLNVAGNTFTDLSYCWSSGEPFGNPSYGYIVADSSNNFCSCSTIDVTDNNFVDVWIKANAFAYFYGGQLSNGNFIINATGSMETSGVEGVPDSTYSSSIRI